MPRDPIDRGAPSRAAATRRHALLTATLGLAAAILAALLLPAAAGAGNIQVGVHEAAFTPAEASVLAKTESRAVRTDLLWSDVQPCAQSGSCGRSKFDFSAINRRYEALSKAGLSPEYVTLVAAPRWATAGCAKKAAFCTPAREHFDDWKRYVGQVLRRYGPNGQFWRSIGAPKDHRVINFALWNEPNHDKNWNGDSSVGEYRRLLAVTREVFDNVAPKARLNAGNVAYGGRSTQPPAWMRSLARQTSAKRDFDALAIHPYSRTPGDVVRKTRATERLPGVREVAITEVGWGIDTASNGPSNAKCVRSEKAQARRLTETFQRLRRDARELVWISWFDAIDNKTGGGCNASPGGKTFGLFKDGASETPYDEKSSLAAFKRFAPLIRRR
ncbi:hypothetical protein HJD18_11675 [Thermoleophilia bacterium SCSIO 60948]|nr:hypothetical protein HJD18_11675 [Thermoleophilia bacterium SCSIO 60948]